MRRRLTPIGVTMPRSMQRPPLSTLCALRPSRVLRQKARKSGSLPGQSELPKATSGPPQEFPCNMKEASGQRTPTPCTRDEFGPLVRDANAIKTLLTNTTTVQNADANVLMQKDGARSLCSTGHRWRGPLPAQTHVRTVHCA